MKDIIEIVLVKPLMSKIEKLIADNHLKQEDLARISKMKLDILYDRATCEKLSINYNDPTVYQKLKAHHYAMKSYIKLKNNPKPNIGYI